ncbi:MAG: hypothetical protein WDO13_08415 [Verrucomicrobiota bacterium]
MAAATIPCPKCQAALEVPPQVWDFAATCPSCASALETHLFPAFFRPVEVGAAASALVDPTEASCYYHPQKQAAGVCDGCGRLICALCSVELGAEHLCPSCIAAGKKKGKLTTLEDHRVRYDSIALSLAIFSFLFYVLAIVLAPAAIYTAVRHWNSPGSLLGVSRTRFVVAIVLALVALAFWILLLTVMILTPHHHAHT